MENAAPKHILIKEEFIMKRLHLTAMIAAVSLALLTACGGSQTRAAEKISSTREGTPGLQYGSTHGGYEVTGYDGPEANVIIPDEYEGYPVVAIAEDAFTDANIDSIVLGDTESRGQSL